jgi:cytochrome c biogenesis protein CcmG, thiol:disulfide interchange protein DsbE
VKIRTVVVTLAVSVAVACSSSPSDLRYARASGPMPAISGPTLTGSRLDRADYAGKVVVVNFWNQDCPPCRREMPLLQSEALRLRDRGVAVIGALYIGGNWPNDPDAARDFLARLGITYPNVLDTSSDLASRFGIAGIPSTIVVDRSGEMRFRVLGRLRAGNLDELLGKLEAE